MKFLKTKIVAILALLSVANYSFGVAIGINNKTNKTLVFMVKERRGDTHFGIVRSNKRAVVNLGSGVQCVGQIKVTPFDPQDKYQGNDPKYSRFKGKNLLEIHEMIAPEMARGDYDTQLNVFYPVARDNSFVTARIVMQPSQVYKDTAKAATAIVSGIDTFACKTVDTVMKAKTGGTIGTDTIDQVTDLLKGDQKEATKKTKEQLDAEKKAKENPADTAAQELAKKKAAEADAARKIVKLDNVLNDIDDLLLAEGSWTEKPVPAAITVLENNKEFLDSVAFGKIRLLLSQGKNEEASKEFQAYIDKLKSSTTKASIDDEAMVYDINTYADTEESDKKGCSFGLKEIAKAAGNLEGISVCKDREFMIYESAEEEEIEVNGKKMKTGHKGFIASTDQGA